MAAQTGPSNNAWKRYTPFIAVVAVIAIVVGILVATSGSDSNKKTSSSNGNGGGGTLPNTKAPWPSYSEAKAAGTLDKYKWDSNCDTQTGLVKLPSWDAPPCMATAPANTVLNEDPDHGITKTTIRVAYYSAPSDPQTDALTKSVGGYDSPGQIAQTDQGFVDAFSKRVQLYGRKVQLVKLQGTGTSTDEQQAQADAITAKSMKVFAVLGGPTQTKSFSQKLAQEGILCIGSCLISRPASFYKANFPYIWPGIEPDQTSAFNVEFVQKQLNNKDAIYAGNPSFRKQKRTFAILSYDTQDGGYKPVWDNWKIALKKAGVKVKGQVNYFLNVNTVQADAQTLVQSLKAINATTVLFTGDPFTPIYFTKEATKQHYFPEWVMAGTVFADTSVFGRQYDKQQWAHAFGMSLIPPRIPVTQSRYYAIYTDCGTKPAPPAYNTQGIIYANENLLFTGLELAGPKLSATTFAAGLDNYPLLARDPNQLRPVTSYGDHSIWPNGTDYGGGDTTGFVWWDPKAPGEDETGTKGTGQYRYIDNGRQYLPGDVPTAQMGMFNTKNTVTYYDNSNKYSGTKPVPSDLKSLPCQD